MVTYSLEALGKVVANLREGKGLTQEQLGRAAGYGKGAGVSVSRLEHGRLTPTRERFAGIAHALGVSTDELEARASDEIGTYRATTGGDIPTHEERIAAIARAHERREQLATQLEALKESSESAEQAFLMRFRRIAGRVIGAPPPDEDRIEDSGGAKTEPAEAEAAYQIQFTQYGVSQALAEAADGRADAGAARGPAAYLAFAEAVALAAVPLGAKVPRLTGASAALSGLRATTGVGRSVSSKAIGVNVLTAVAVGSVVATIMERRVAAKRSRRQQESDANLAAAEEDIAAHEPNVEALFDVIARAAEVFDYIAVHAGHALTRWSAQIGDDVVPWNELSEAERQRYRDFVAIAAAQLAVTTIDLQTIATSRGAELEQATSVADQLLIQSKLAITERV